MDEPRLMDPRSNWHKFGNIMLTNARKAESIRSRRPIHSRITCSPIQQLLRSKITSSNNQELPTLPGPVLHVRRGPDPILLGKPAEGIYVTKRLSAFLTVCAMATSGCGADSTPETLGLGPDWNSTAPRTVADSDFTTSPTGLKTHDFVMGTGDEATFGLIATVHYTGWLTNGLKFDSSLDRNDPFAFRLGAGDVIRGWDEGVAGMRVGGKRQIVIPPALAYGASGNGSVPPNSILVFQIELLRLE